MNTSLPNLARQSAIKTDPCDAPPPPHFRDDTSSSDDAFSMDEAPDIDSGDLQHIKPAAVKPTLNLKNVPIWDNTISTRDNAQAIKIALGSAGYLDTTKGKGTRQEQMMLLAALRHATAHYPMALAIVNSINMDSRKCGYAAWTALFTELQGSAIEERRRLEEEITAGQLPNEPVQVYVRRCRNLWNSLHKAHGQWTFDYVAINYLIPGLRPAYDHIVDATIPATNVTKRLAIIIISAGQNMEERTRQRQQRAHSRTPTLNSCDPSDQLHAIRPNIVCSRCDRPGHAQHQCLARRHANGLRLLGDTAPPSTVNNPSYGHYQRAPAGRHVNDNYTHNLRNDYNHQNSPQRQQYWPTQSDNDDLQRHHQPFGFVSPAGHHHYGHHPANNDSDQQPTGCQEAHPLMGVSLLAPHHSGLPVMLTCTTTAPGGAATGAQEGEGEDDDDDEFHESWHVPYSNSDDNFQCPFSHPWRARQHFRSHPIPTPIQPLCLASPAFPTSAALAAHDVHTGQGALRGDLPPPLPILTAAPLLHMPSSSLVIEHLFSPCHGPSAFEVEAVVEYGFSIHAFIGADPSTEARTMWPHHLHVISNKYPGRLPPSAFQDCHDGTPMNINDITITELERLRPFTLVVSSAPLQPWSPTGSRLDWRDHRSRAFASIISFTRFYLSSQPTPVRYIVQNCPNALALPEVLSSFGACNIVRAASCGSEVHRDTLLWTIITQPQDIRNCGNNVAAIKLADPGPFSGCRIYNPATGRRTPPLSMPAVQFSNAAYLMDAFQPSGQQEGPHAPPPMLPSAALASAQEGPPPPHHNEQHPPHHQEGDATALSAPHTRKEAQLTSHYVDLSNYHPTLVASAIAAVVRPRSARLTALALPAPTVRVSTAPRNYQEDISSTRPDDWTKSMNHEINSITTMALFVWVNVPELRRDNESHVIQQTAWAFAAQHGDGDIKREAGVIVRGNLLTTGETYAYDYLPLGCGRKVRAWHPVEALYDLPQASKAWFLSLSSFLHDFGFGGSEPGGVMHLHRETCIIDILTTFHMTKSKPRRWLCTLNTNFHNTAVAYRQEGVRVAHDAINALRNAANTVKYRLAEARRADKTPPVELFDINNKLLASDDNSLIDVNEYMVGLNARKRAKLMGKLRDGL
eukprot:jgi/Tetstr1/438837/TSEL_027346.t1